MSKVIALFKFCNEKKYHLITLLKILLLNIIYEVMWGTKLKLIKSTHH